jgi:hypothetical protein
MQTHTGRADPPSLLDNFGYRIASTVGEARLTCILVPELVPVFAAQLIETSIVLPRWNSLSGCRVGRRR